MSGNEAILQAASPLLENADFGFQLTIKYSENGIFNISLDNIYI